jgi:hypothetical protein
MRSNRTYLTILVLPFIMLGHGASATEDSHLVASHSACNPSAQPNPLVSLSADCKHYIKHHFRLIASTKVVTQQLNLRDTKNEKKAPITSFEQRAFSTRVGSYNRLSRSSTTTQNCVLNHYELKYHINNLVDQLGYASTNRAEKIVLINQSLKESRAC